MAPDLTMYFTVMTDREILVFIAREQRHTRRAVRVNREEIANIGTRVDRLEAWRNRQRGAMKMVAVLVTIVVAAIGAFASFLRGVG